MICDADKRAHALYVLIRSAFGGFGTVWPREEGRGWRGTAARGTAVAEDRGRGGGGEGGGRGEAEGGARWRGGRKEEVVQESRRSSEDSDKCGADKAVARLRVASRGYTIGAVARVGFSGSREDRSSGSGVGPGEVHGVERGERGEGHEHGEKEERVSRAVGRAAKGSPESVC
jgi:hypothetical protein